MSIRYFFLLFFLSSLVFLSFISRCSAKDDDICKGHNTNCSVHDGSLSGDLSSKNFTKDDKSIEDLDLSQNKIISINKDFWEMEVLSSLKKLDLSFNEINQSLSKNIRKLSSLESLNLSRNSFHGEVPYDELTKLKNLTELDLSMNQFDWNISLLNGNLNFSNLRFLSLAGNLVRQNLSNIGNFSSLEDLNLSSTGIEGSIPTNISNLTNLVRLDLSNNSNLKCPIINLNKIKSLEYLNLSGINLFSEKNLSSMGDLKNLSQLDLSNTRLAVKLPARILELKKLTELDLSHNNLTGGLFDFKNLTYLMKLNMSFNKLTEKIPDFSNMTNLTVLDLSHNNLKGQISNFSNMTDLKVLDLSHNNLTGQIPEFSNMTDLKVLNLSNNHLSGSISEAMEKKMQNMKVDLSNNGNFTSCSTNTTFLSSFKLTNSSCGKLVLENSRKSDTAIVLIVVLPIIFLIVILTFLVFAYRRRSKLLGFKQLWHSGDCSSQEGPYKFQTEAKEWVVDVKLPTTVPVLIFDRPLTKITFADLLVATSNFSRQSLLAEECFGLVYAGYLPEGHPVAIKVLVNGLSLSDQEVADELERLAQIKHQNLVQLMGYCIAGRQRIIIYDYMQNGTLRDLLHKVPDYREDGRNFPLEEVKYDVEEIANNGQVQDTWKFRHRIALGVARGLAFLHHGCSPSIIHGFIRARSILLDSNLEPRLSDYALYRLTSIKFQDDNPYGSPGYMSEATAESDVYDFGVLLLELLTGKQASDDQNPGLAAYGDLVNWVRGLSKKTLLSEAIDVKIRGTGPKKQMEEALRIGYLCTADVPSKRPSMKQVIGILKDIEPNIENTGN